MVKKRLVPYSFIIEWKILMMLVCPFQNTDLVLIQGKVDNVLDTTVTARGQLRCMHADGNSSCRCSHACSRYLTAARLEQKQ